MSSEECKLIEISLAKIEHSKSSRKAVGVGKASMLHRNLLVNSVLNRVRNTDKTAKLESFMDYREPRSIDSELDENDIIEKCTTLHEMRQTRSSSKKANLLGKQLDINSNELPKTTTQYSQPRTVSPLPQDLPIVPKFEKQTDMDIAVYQLKTNSSDYSPKKNCKRSRSKTDSCDKVVLPIKKMKASCWSSDMSAYSVSSLSSLFNELVANADADSGLNFCSTYITATACC